MPRIPTIEDHRLEEARTRKKHWKRWGPYLSERQWGTVREDYSADGTAWEYFPHDHARSRAYRWGEDGIGGISDRHQMMCFGLALWNGRDPILKERLFGLTGNQGNHGEDVKECYFYLDALPSHAYQRMLYKLPQRAYPYAELIADQEHWTRRILDFLGLPWDERCLDFHKTVRPVATASFWQVRQKIYKSSVERWRNYEKFIGPLLNLRDRTPA